MSSVWEISAWRREMVVVSCCSEEESLGGPVARVLARAVRAGLDSERLTIGGRNCKG